jgi:hypothetical protein
MSEEDTSTTDEGTDDGATTDTGKTFTQADIDRIVKDRVARATAKFADYGDLKKRVAAAMTDQEKVVAEAERRGAETAATKAGSRLVRAEFRAAASGRVEKETLAAYLEDVDLTKFLAEDGEPDLKAIEARISRLAGPERGTDFDGGVRRTTSGKADMNALIRRSAGFS